MMVNLHAAMLVEMLFASLTCCSHNKILQQHIDFTVRPNVCASVSMSFTSDQLPLSSVGKGPIKAKVPLKTPMPRYARPNGDANVTLNCRLCRCM